MHRKGRSVKTSAWVSIALGAALTAAGAAAHAGDLEVSVTGPAGRAVASGSVIVLDREYPMPAPGKTLVIKGLPDRRIAVTAEGPAELKAGQPTARLVGVADIKTLPGKTVAAAVTLQPVTDLSAWCSSCHPAAGEPAKPDQILRDLHPSGKELSEHFFKNVKAHNAKVAEQRRKKDPKAQYPIPLEERIVVVGGKKVVKQFYVCESCHTLHLRTPWAKAVRAPYDESNDLCSACHRR